MRGRAVHCPRRYRAEAAGARAVRLQGGLRNRKGIIIKAVVIGSGFGGLALAIRLQSAGMDTLILEQRDKPGGRAYVYQDQGFTFDAGPTVITDPTALEALFALSGRRLEDYSSRLFLSVSCPWNA